MTVEKTIRTSAKRGKTRQLILDAAAKMISRHGYHATYLKDVAAAVNMKAGSLYYHFESKEALMHEVLDKSVKVIYDTVKAEVEALGSEPDFPSLLKAAIRGHLIAIFRYPDYTLASIRNYGVMPDVVQQAAQKDRDAYEEFWRDFFDKAEAAGYIRPSVDKNLLRLAIFGSMNWSSLWYEKSGASIEQIAESQADLFLNGCYQKGEEDGV
ncbi:MAG: TetR/AcrR family transcriptional regulator [Cycloclasticus sp.]